jgi:hypothetical protein
VIFAISVTLCPVLAAQNVGTPAALGHTDAIIDGLVSTPDFGTIYIADGAGDGTVLNDKPSTAVKNIVKLQGAAIPVLIRHLEEAKQIIANLAEFVVRARTHVPRESYSHEILYKPEAEASPRLAQQLAQLAKGSALLDGRTHVDAVDMTLVRRVAFDSMPADRRSVLDHLGKQHGPISQTDLIEALAMKKPFVQRRVEDLGIVGLVDCKQADDNIDPDLRTVNIELSQLASDLLAGCSTV